MKEPNAVMYSMDRTIGRDRIPPEFKIIRMFMDRLAKKWSLSPIEPDENGAPPGEGVFVSDYKYYYDAEEILDKLFERIK